MKKLALFLALCLLIQAVGLTAFAEETPADIPEVVQNEEPAPEAPAEEEVPVEEEAPAEEEAAE